MPSLTRPERVSLAAMAGVVAVLHAVGLGVLFLAVVPAHLGLGSSGVFGAGLGVTAYTLGVRHAFDADHIAGLLLREQMCDVEARAAYTVPLRSAASGPRWDIRGARAPSVGIPASLHAVAGRRDPRSVPLDRCAASSVVVVGRPGTRRRPPRRPARRAADGLWKSFEAISVGA